MNLELEKFIGKHIDEVLKLEEIEHEHEKFCTFKVKPDATFFEIQYFNLQTTINTDKIIESVSINFALILDRVFYDKMIKDYGIPNNILVLDKLISESKTERTGEFSQNLTKRHYSMKEVSFEDKPFSVFWKKRDYQIEMTFHYEHNGTQLKFRKF